MCGDKDELATGEGTLGQQHTAGNLHTDSIQIRLPTPGWMIRLAGNQSARITDITWDLQPHV
jgi:hypothetical protein